MKTATARLVINDLGSDIPIGGLTPAEALVLGAMHMPNVKDYPLREIEEGPEIKRSAMDEVKRLRAKYGKTRINELFPGKMPSLPKDFDEARAAVVDNPDDAGSAGPGVLFGSPKEAEALEKSGSQPIRASDD